MSDTTIADDLSQATAALDSIVRQFHRSSEVPRYVDYAEIKGMLKNARELERRYEQGELTGVDERLWLNLLQRSLFLTSGIILGEAQEGFRDWDIDSLATLLEQLSRLDYNVVGH